MKYACTRNQQRSDFPFNDMREFRAWKMNRVLLLFRLFDTDLLFGVFNVETFFLESAKDTPDAGFA